MAVTHEKSDLRTNATASPVVQNPAYLDSGKLRVQRFLFTQGSSAGDAGSTAELCSLPPGKVVVFLPLSRIHVSALGTARTFDLGHAAYTALDGTAVAEDLDDLDVDVDVSSAVAITPAGTIGTHESKVFESRDGVIIKAQVNDGTIPAAATIGGYIVYAVE